MNCNFAIQEGCMKIGLLALPLLTTVTAVQAQSKADIKTAERLKKDITYLASDELEGRLTGSEGEHKAAAYIVKRYADEGVPPYKGQYQHPFHFTYGKGIGKATHIKVGNNDLRMKEDAFPLPFSKNKHVSGEVLPDVLESDNIWLVNLYADKDEAENPHFKWEKVMYDRAKEAEKQGAKGIVFYDGYGAKWPPVYNALSEYETVNIPVAFIGHDAFEKYIQDEDGNYVAGVPLSLDINIKKTERTGTNIAAYIDNHKPYTVVIGAHYDHLGRGEDGNSLYTGKDKAIHNGADDNASGTAALLEMAGWVKHHKLRHYNYLFVNFSGEELGLLGSKNFVKDEKLDSNHIAYMINMDMVGRLNDSTRALTIGGVGTSPAWAAYVNKDDGPFKIVIDSSGIGPSDHTSFYLQGIPVLFFFTGTHKDYHKPSDDADKINYNGEVAVMKYVYNVVETMDENPKPAFTTTKQSSMARVDFKVTLGIMPDYSYQDRGVRVDGVSDDRPAKRAGIKEGDVITALGTYKVEGLQSYMEALGKFNPGDATQVEVKRGVESIKLPVIFDK